MFWLVTFLLGYDDGIKTGNEFASASSVYLRLKEAKYHYEQGNFLHHGASFPGSPLLLFVVLPSNLRFLPFVLATALSALLLFLVGKFIQSTRLESIATEVESTSKERLLRNSKTKISYNLGKVAASLYSFNPIIVAAMAAKSPSSIEAFFVYLSLFGALRGKPFYAALGTVLSTHVSLHTAVLSVPVLLMLKNGNEFEPAVDSKAGLNRVLCFTAWVFTLGSLSLLACKAVLGSGSSLLDMLSGMVLTVLGVEPLPPNLGMFWYFFAEVFEHDRAFFAVAFFAVFLSLVAPVSVRLQSKPTALFFILLCLVAFFKPSSTVADVAMAFSLLPIALHGSHGELKFGYALFLGALYVACAGPVLCRLWIWKGVGNANFVYGISLMSSCLQAIAVVQALNSLSTKG